MTTRDENVLSLCRVDGIYKPKLMDAVQSLDLFKRYAFQSRYQPQDTFLNMSMKVVAVAGGLPLALRVFGSYLSDKSDLAEWSFKRSLIKWVRDDGPFDMHDLIRDMGRDIVPQGQPDKPWSRLWTAVDTLNMLEENRSNSVTEGISLSLSQKASVLARLKKNLSSGAFGEMKRLRVLRVNNVSFKGENFMLPKALKVLFLRVTKIESLSSCNLENLVTLELHVADDMSELLVFNALKFLKISCHSIRVTPDFSNMPHLEMLEFSYFAGCHLSFNFTSNSSQDLNLPERLGNLESLNMLELDDLAITSIPTSIGQLTMLSEMYLRKLDRLHSLPDSISSLNSLQVFNVEGTDLKGMKIDGGDLMDIDRLDISSCNWLSVLPASSLKKARVLCITDSRIKELPESIEAMEKIEELS
ncbi:hypothetical protein EJ110_NYTH11595 [Nymphaea thermarum]|nr:hypothetical protein EJ110_NYTH11595 [Nymphaea thermarum]